MPYQLNIQATRVTSSRQNEKSRLETQSPSLRKANQEVPPHGFRAGVSLVLAEGYATGRFRAKPGMWYGVGGMWGRGGP